MQPVNWPPVKSLYLDELTYAVFSLCHLHSNVVVGEGRSSGGDGGEAAAFEHGLAVLVEVEFSDDAIGGLNAHGAGLALLVVTGDFLDVDDVLGAIDLDDLALDITVLAADNADLVVFTDGGGVDFVGGLQVLGQSRGHQHPLLG